MKPEIQDLLGNNGGVPVAADPAAITDPKNKELIDNFNKISSARRAGLLPGLAGARLLRRPGRRRAGPDQRLEDARRDARRDRQAVQREPRRPRQVSRLRRRRAAHGPARRGYGVYLIPGVLASLAVIVVPLVMTVGISFTQWTGVGEPDAGSASTTTPGCSPTRTFWASFGHILLLIVAMAVVPTLLGLLLAAVLFDYVAKVFGNRWAGLFRSGFYLPQVLPVAVTGIVWGWILHPSYGALNKILDTVGLGSLGRNWLGDPDYALYSVMAVMIWFQLGYPIVMFMSGLQRIDPELYEAADLDGAGLVAALPADHRLPDPARVLRGAGDHHDRRAEDLRPDLRADPRRPEQRHAGAVVLRLQELLREGPGRVRLGDLHRAHRADRRAGVRLPAPAEPRDRSAP